MTSWHSYPKVYALGHSAIQDIFLDPVVVQEKVDGSQFSFGLIDGTLKVKSKNREMLPEAPDSLFAEAVETVKALHADGKLDPGVTYRGEVLKKQKHNAIAYDRVPKGNIILFDANLGHEKYYSPDELLREGERLGLETVPVYHWGKLDSIEEVKSFMDSVSTLGGQKVEGIVVKNYTRFSVDGKAMMGKLVSEAFKEVHRKSWKSVNPEQTDILNRIGAQYKTESRWHKAVQHLKEDGTLLGDPKDIGNLLKEVNKDIEEECKEDIKEELWRWAKKHIQRQTTNGLPEWYKNQLLKRSNF